MSSPNIDWSALTSGERAAAFRAHHSGGMPYPGLAALDGLDQ
jgi:hypothetical protein